MPDQDPLRPPDSSPPPSLPSAEGQGITDRPLTALPVYTDEGFEEQPLPAIAIPERPHPRGFWWAILYCVGFIVVTQIPAALVFLVVFMAITPDALEKLKDTAAAMKMPEYAQAMAVALLSAQILGIIGSLIVLRLLVGRDWPRKVALRLPSWQHVVLVLLGFPGMYLLAVGVDMVAKQVFQAAFGEDSLIGLDEMVKLFGQWPIHFAFVAVALGPGLAEELFCRGFLGRGLVGKYGVIGGLLLTSFFFGLLHLEPRQVAYAFLIGALLHGAYLATRSLWIPILLHVVNNGFSVVALHLEDVRDLGDTQPIPVYIFVAAAILIAGVGYALYDSRARLVSTNPYAAAWQPDYPGVEYPPPGSETLVFRPKPTALHWCAALGGVLIFLSAVALASATAR